MTLPIIAILFMMVQNPSFEVASIKPNAVGHIDLGGGQWVLSGRTHCQGTDARAARGDLIPLPGLGRCSVRNSTLKEMIDVAYNLRIGPVRSKLKQMILGGPGWTDTAPFDIEAKTEDPSAATEEQLRLMLQTLLADRFKLKFHHETREVSGFAFVVAKDGPKLKEADASETPNFNMIPPAMTAQNIRLDPLVNFLALRLGRVVTDNTGLKGRYDFSLTWTPSEGELAPNGSPVRLSATDQPGPSLMTALQEQLGLRLEPQKVAMDLVVIDAAEMPGEN